MLRDFSEEAKSKLLSLMDIVEMDKYSDATNSLNRNMSHYEAYTGGLKIRNSLSSVENYHQSVIEKNQSSKKQIEQIFADVQSVDSRYSGNIANVSQSVQQLIQYIREMASITTVNSGLFSHGYISTKLTPMMDEIDKYEFVPVEKVEINEQEFIEVQDSMLTFENGRPNFNVGGIVGYLASQYDGLSFLEKTVVGDVLTYMKDTTEFYAKVLTMNPLLYTPEIIERISWLGEDNLLEKLSQTSDYYGQLYNGTMQYFAEQAQIEGTLANKIVESVQDKGPSILKNVGTALLATSPLGVILGGGAALSKIAGADGTEIKYTNSEAGIDFTDSLIQNGSREEYNGNILEKEIGTRRKTKDYTNLLDLGSVGIKKEYKDSEWENEIDTFNGGKITNKVGATEAYFEVSGGMSVLTADGDYILAPNIHAEMGTSISAFESEWEQQWLGNENLGVSTKTKVTVGKAEAKLSGDAQFINENGQLDVEVASSGSIEYIAGAAEGEVKLNVLGGGVSAKGEVSFGIGAHYDVGYKDGVLKVDVGAALGLGVAVDFEIDVGGMINTVSGWCSSIWS